MSAILDLPFSIDLIDYALDQELYDAWMTLYPFMLSGLMNFIKFEDYKNKLQELNIRYTQKSSEDILKEMLLVISGHENKNRSVTTSKT